MRYVSGIFKPRCISLNDDDYYPDGECGGHVVYEQERDNFTGLYDHEGNPVFKINDFKMGFI